MSFAGDDDVVVRRQLHSIAGVNPSYYWYRACINELQLQEQIDNTTGDTNSLATAVLDQILYNDLHNVIRTIADDNQQIQQNDISSSSILRDAIRQSMTAENSYKSVLPQSFRLLVQINEFVDAASSLDKRMEAINDTNPSAPTQTCYPPASRCLKFCYTDGYTNTFNIENRSLPVDTTNMFVAMELSPLDGLGTQYQLIAGLKILLHGEIIIRHGVAGWHSGCATILGGSVEHLVEIQRQALVYAKKESGSGVDPTVKALVRNNPLMAIENENDGKMRCQINIIIARI
jgi:RecQ mediated genome instability protein